MNSSQKTVSQGMHSHSLVWAFIVGLSWYQPKWDFAEGSPNLLPLPADASEGNEYGLQESKSHFCPDVADNMSVTLTTLGCYQFCNTLVMFLAQRCCCT